MRTLVFITSLIFSYIVGTDAKILSSPASLELSGAQTPEGISGILLAALFVVAGLLSFVWPKASFAVYIFLGCAGIFASITGFTRIHFWGFPFVLAILSYFGGQKSYQRHRAFKTSVISSWFHKRARDTSSL